MSKKYCLISRPQIRNLPLPGVMRTRATAVLRRPVPQMYVAPLPGLGVGAGAVTVVACCSLTRVVSDFLNLAQVQVLTVLRLVRMIGAALYLHLGELTATEGALGKHPTNCLHDDPFGMIAQH